MPNAWLFPVGTIPQSGEINSMAGSLNRCAFIGNLGKDPEVRRTNNGDPVVSFSIACSESWRDKQSGEKKDKTEWVNCVVFNEGIAKVVEDYCKKGSKVYVEGAFQTRKWTDKEGHDRYSSEIVLAKFRGTLVLLGDGRGGDSDGDADRGESRRSAPAKPKTGGGNIDPYSDEIPFAPEWR
jgi:single-strand DNA-binding protein